MVCSLSEAVDIELSDCTPTKKWKDIWEGAPKQSAIDSQVGGDHYTTQGIQPLEATFSNFGYEGLQAAVYTKVNKYLTREKGTHRQDLNKAIHVLQMQVEYYDRHNALEHPAEAAAKD